MFNLKQKYLGVFKEERDGVMCVVKKWEQVTPVDEYNETLSTSVATLEAQKITAEVPVGEVVTMTNLIRR